MLASGSRRAPHTCLRCQLRQVIFPSRRPCLDRPFAPVRAFSATLQRREDEDDRQFRVPRPRDELVYHHPLGRIVGAPGRRQRQGTQKLQIDAMKQPFEVIVMQDVREPEEQKVRPRKAQHNAVMSAADIQREMASEGVDPTQDEVNESINALRPDTSLLDENEYKALAKSLTDGFTAEQLHAFFTQSLNLSAVPGETVHLLRQQPSELQTRYRRTQWRAGRTRMEKRLPFGTVINKAEKPNKTKLAEQILRLTWNLAIHAEEQKAGELEMKLESWEIKFLLDLNVIRSPGQHVPMWEAIVGSAFLVRACDVRAHRVQGYLRISGRRQDAEAVAHKLEKALPSIQSSAVDLGVFTPLLGTRGWPTSLTDLFSKEDINFVQQRTATIVERPAPETLCIFYQSRNQRREAWRLLFSLLEFPTRGSVTCLHKESMAAKKAVLLPEFAGTSLHFRHRKLDLARLSLPTNREFDEAKLARQTVSTVSSRLIKKELVAFHDGLWPSRDAAAKSRWMEPRMESWKAQFCRILHRVHESHKTAARGSKSRDIVSERSRARTVANCQVRHLDTLLSFFKPRAGFQTRPHLVARFVPAPTSPESMSLGDDGMTMRPTIELLYRFFKTEEGISDIYLTRARAIHDEQELQVPLPVEATDVRLHRRGRMIAKASQMLRDPEVGKFTQTLRESLQSAQDAKLVGRPHVQLHLPAAWATGEAGREDVGDVLCSYMFTGFEQEHKRDYSPVEAERLPKNMDAKTKALFTGFGEQLFLEIREVYAGTMGGRRMEVGLHYRPVQSPAPEPREKDPTDEEQRQAQAGVEDGVTGTLSQEEPASDADIEHPETDALDEEADAPLAPQDKGLPVVIKTALGLARFMTKIAASQVQPLVLQQSQAQAQEGEQKEAEGEGSVADEAAGAVNDGESANRLEKRGSSPLVVR